MKKGCIIVVLIIISCFFLILSSESKESKGKTIEEEKAKKEPLLTKEKRLKNIKILPLIPEEKLKYEIKSYEEVSLNLAQEKRCLACHEGIEVINQRMAEAWGADKNCIVCHRGNDVANTKELAHKDMIVHPGDYRVIALTCGQCHDDNGFIRKDVENLIPGVTKISRVVSRGERNHVPRSLRNIMSTASGEIAATRYLWNAQIDKKAEFGVRDVKCINEEKAIDITMSTALKKLPKDSQHPADSLLRNSCLKCHLWTRGEELPGFYRGGGCDACHVIYGEKGLSASKDPTLSKTSPGHPLKHEITVKIPNEQCLHCHNKEGARIGFSYTGLVINQTGAGIKENKKTYGENVFHINPDIHYEKGLSCIDCHTTKELHGDGNIYNRMEHEVSITCEGCHGTPYAAPTLQTRKGEVLSNLSYQGGDLILTSKITGERFPVRQIDKLMERDALNISMKIPAHLKEMKDRNTLECYSCHSLMAQQLYGFNFKKDDRKNSPLDWLEGTGEAVITRTVPSLWNYNFTFLRWEYPIMGINAKTKVSPFIPFYQSFFTHISKEGEILAQNKVFKNNAGMWGLSLEPINPHTTNRKSLACEYCHSNPKALGFGTNLIDSKANGWPIEFSLERMVNEWGIPVQQTTSLTARPFNKKELGRINMVNSCNACHKEMSNQDIWKKVTDVFDFAQTNEKHKNILDIIFKQGALQIMHLTPQEGK
jgi:hypothetical protein